jgi:AcrR family transcriptional regulator
MVRLSPDVRRDVILDATVRVMRRKGMAATTVRDVAHEMGTSSGLIHHYVDSMDGLLAAAFERAAGEDLDATRRALAGAAGPVERLGVFFAS